VFNVRFEVDGAYYDYLEVGDAEYGDMEEIVEISRYHGNEDRLEWDLFNIPHHCSYRALADEKGDQETTPTPLVKDLLRKGRADSYIVSCSKPVPDIAESYKQTQPPHIQARKAYERYLREVGGRSFLVTMEEPNAYKPQPIVFDIERGGVTWQRATTLGAAAIIAARPPRAGRG
jgi:hypothetical protein